MSSQKRKIDILVIGVCSLTDKYPNAKYKHKAILDLDEYETESFVKDIGVSTSYWSVSNSSSYIGKILFFVKLLLNSIHVFFVSLYKRPKTVYILYPSLILALFFCVVPKRYKPKILIDGFISIFDTVVLDRQLFTRTGLISRTIYLLEKLAYKNSDSVLVDTKENGEFYSELFNINEGLFLPIPLSIPILPEISIEARSDNKVKLVFFGTFVPLHGISIIIDAAKELSGNSNYEFHIIGDGQEAQILEEALSLGLENITWHRGLFDTQELTQKVATCDIGLGIFSVNNKAMRVIPYKYYYYLNMGLPVITSRTPAMDSLVSDFEIHGAINTILVDPGSPDSLVAAIKEMSNRLSSVDPLFKLTVKKQFNNQLGVNAINKRLREVFDSMIS